MLGPTSSIDHGSSIGDGRDRGPHSDVVSGPRFPTDEQVAPTSGDYGDGDEIGACSRLGDESGPNLTPLPISTTSILGEWCQPLPNLGDRNAQYTPTLSRLCCFLPFGFLRLPLLGHVTAPDFISPARVQPTDKTG
jgi:hypothetical protein